MEEALGFLLLVAISVTVFLLTLKSNTGYLRLPCLFSAVYLGWVLPQLWSIRQGANTLTEDLPTLYVVAILCLIAAVVGWRIGIKVQWRSSFGVNDDRRVLIAAIVVTAIAVGGWVGIGLHPVEERAETAWSGPLTILAFLANLKILSLSLSGILFFRSRGKLAAALLIVNGLLYAPLVLIYFRRRAMAECAAGLALAFWFGQGRTLARAVVIGGLVVGSLVTFAVGNLRGLAMRENGEWQMPSLAEIMSIDFLSTTPFESTSASPELLNALALVHVTALDDSYTWGQLTWNRFVFQYVPAQILGSDLKAGFMADTDVESILETRAGYVATTGSTLTGFGESFQEFGYFGLIFFLLTGLVMGRWWQLGSKGDIWYQALYSAGLIPAVLSITAYPSYFFVTMLFFWIILKVLSFGRPRSGRNPQDHKVQRLLPSVGLHRS